MSSESRNDGDCFLQQRCIFTNVRYVTATMVVLGILFFRLLFDFYFVVRRVHGQRQNFANVSRLVSTWKIWKKAPPLLMSCSKRSSRTRHSWDFLHPDGWNILYISFFWFGNVVIFIQSNILISCLLTQMTGSSRAVWTSMVKLFEKESREISFFPSILFSINSWRVCF